MEKRNKKEVAFSLLGVFILVLAVVGISYAIWTKTIYGEKENSITTGSVSFQYHESDTNVISITNALPMEDEQGKRQSASNSMFDFSVSGKVNKGSINYDVYAIEESSNTLPKEFVKVYLTDQNDHALSKYTGDVPTYSSLEDYTYSNQVGKLLYHSILNRSSQTHNLRLRIWVSPKYEENEKKATFAFKVNVVGSM